MCVCGWVCTYETYIHSPRVQVTVCGLLMCLYFAIVRACVRACVPVYLPLSFLSFAFSVCFLCLFYAFVLMAGANAWLHCDISLFPLDALCVSLCLCVCVLAVCILVLLFFLCRSHPLFIHPFSFCFFLCAFDPFVVC
eukprot:Opistho-2@87524